MMKKNLCILLSAILLFSSVTVFPADTPEAEATALQTTAAAEISTQEKEAVDLLNALNIADVTAQNATANISRGAFAKLACEIAGYPLLSTPNALFDDVPSNSEYAKYIYTLQGYGVVTGFSDNTFRPELNMISFEAAIILMRIMDYGMMAELKGGYPFGYSYVANDIGLYKGITSDRNASLTFGSAAFMCENALSGYVAETIINGDRVSYKKNEITLGKRALGIEIKKGIVDGIDLTRLYGENNIPPYNMSVNGELMDYGSIDAVSYLGYDVKVYLREIKGIDRVFYIRKTDRNSEITADAENIKSIGGGRVTYDENGKTRTENYDITAAVIYNGVSTMTGFNTDMVKDKLGKVRMLDNDNDGMAEVVFVDLYDNYVVAAKDANTYTIYDYYDKNKKVSLDTNINDPYVVIYGEDGSELSFSSIKKFSVVTVYSSLPDAFQQFKRAYVSTEVVRGTVLSITKDADEVMVELSSGTYTLTPECYNALKSIENPDEDDEKVTEYLLPGVMISILLDVNGKGAYATVSSNEGAKYGFLIQATAGKGLAGEPQFKIFTLSSKAEVFDCAPSITIDEVRFKSGKGQEIIAMLNKTAKANDPAVTDPECVSQLVKYTLNSEGKLTYIDTASKDAMGTLGTYDDAYGDNALFRKALAENTKYRTNSNSFMGVGVINGATTPVFLHPIPGSEDYLNEDNYEIRTNYFTTDTPYKNVKLYYDKQQSVTSTAVTIAAKIGSDVIAERAQFCYFVKSTQVITDDDLTLTNLYFYIDGSLQKKECAENVAFKYYSEQALAMTVSDLKKGDVFRYNLDNKGRICKIEMIYSPTAASTAAEYPGKVYSPTTNHDFYTSFRVRMMRVINNFEDGIEAKILDGGISYENGIEILTKTGTVMIYEPGTNESQIVRPGTFEDLKASETTDDPSIVMIHQWWGVTQSAYIIKQ